MNPILEILAGQCDGQRAIYSVCTASPLVIQAALLDAKRKGYTAVIESTANQVNQFGGYTGMSPEEYAKFVRKLAGSVGLPEKQLVLGGDHLGPLTWSSETEETAMEKARNLVAAYVTAGYTKIHLDTSMRLVSDDQNAPLDVSVCAYRCAELAKAAFDAFDALKAENPEAVKPVFIIGSEVPIPGGSMEHEDFIRPTAPEEFQRQYQTFRETFEKEGLSFEDVVAFVVQPGVEFGDDFVFQYNQENAASLTAALKQFTSLVFEGHSTDYQTPESLRAMVDDGIRILKVGPALTYTQREALCVLQQCEEEFYFGTETSKFWETLLGQMNLSNRYWKKYYTGTDAEIEYKKKFSFSDRCRYYLPETTVEAAIEQLFVHTLEVPIGLISQYFPQQYPKVMAGVLPSDGRSLVIDRICERLDDYWQACER